VTPISERMTVHAFHTRIQSLHIRPVPQQANVHFLIGRNHNVVKILRSELRAANSIISGLEARGVELCRETLAGNFSAAQHDAQPAKQQHTTKGNSPNYNRDDELNQENVPP
jgi:hypothetical protein